MVLHETVGGQLVPRLCIPVVTSVVNLTIAVELRGGRNKTCLTPESSPPLELFRNICVGFSVILNCRSEGMIQPLQCGLSSLQSGEASIRHMAFVPVDSAAPAEGKTVRVTRGASGTRLGGEMTDNHQPGAIDESGLHVPDQPIRFRTLHTTTLEASGVG